MWCPSSDHDEVQKESYYRQLYYTYQTNSQHSGGAAVLTIYNPIHTHDHPQRKKVTADTGCCVDELRSNIPLLTVLSFLVCMRRNYFLYLYNRCTTQLAKLILNHSIGCTHIRRF